MWRVVQFETICNIAKYKNTYGDTLILVKVAEWSAASLKLTLLPKRCKLSQIQDKVHFQVVLVCFFQVF